MYVVNIEDYPKEALYFCNGIIANYLITNAKLPLLGKTKEGKFAFSKTENLEKALKAMPFRYKMTRNYF